jgi:hypothetical protein
MCEIGESLKVGEVDEDEIECPFDHELQPPKVDNDVIGVGGTLARRMKSAVGTYMYDKYKEKVDPILNPRHRPDHRFYNKAKVVKIEEDENGTVHVHQYPVTCAAHHCIPAQESLKESPLLTFMVKKGTEESLNDGSYSSGSVWADVGYDVNGSQNGIYLPGSYAVGGGRGGMGVWANNEDGDEDAPDEPDDLVPDAESNLLTGDLNEISFDNRKWLYVSQAVDLCPGQFHDRHLDYSQFVQSVLRKIFVNYKSLYKEKIVDSKCPKCKERADKIKELGIPTPFGLVTRLNKVSDKFKNCLNGTTWRRNIFTSKWGQAYMEEVRKGNPAAKAGVSG